MSLPPLSSLTSPTLTTLLATLFEPSPALHNLLVPSVLHQLKSSQPTTYAQLIDLCAQVANEWSWSEKADFLSGHPMIGEQGKVSALSGKEQGQAVVTPKVVLDRLSHLNALYCQTYPSLRFITFVNGRPRSAIVTELEHTLGIAPSPVPLPDDYPTSTPALDSTEAQSSIRPIESDEWRVECERGLGDVWKIGKARLGTLGVV